MTLRDLVQVICFIEGKIRRGDMQYSPNSPPHFPVTLEVKPMDHLEMWCKRAQGIDAISLMMSHYAINIDDSFDSDVGT